ncbi:MAG: iron ABC transporter substrate-binding protein [Chloroflexi bacterium]|nr:iron ABC transporter substrate-binding protein [Chloroflexota bacterium]
MVAGAGLVAACAAPSAQQSAASARPAGSDVTLTFYNAQREETVKAMTDGFTRETGIKVNIRNGKDFELANQIVQEGAASPADLFITENSPAMQVVDAKGLFAPVDKATLAQIPPGFSPSTGTWVGVAARATVLVYNPSLLPASQLPASILDLGSAAWRGKVGFAPAGADFQAVASAVVATKGEAAAATWLKGLKENGTVYSGNVAIMKAVNAGEVPAGIIYHYYWSRDRAESGANSKNAELYYFPNKDPGGFVSVSGLGGLKSSKYPRETQQLMQYMTGPAGQKILAEGTALEYSLNPNVPTNPKLKPLSALSIPEVDIAKLNGPRVIELMQQAGLL